MDRLANSINTFLVTIRLFYTLLYSNCICRQTGAITFAVYGTSNIEPVPKIPLSRRLAKVHGNWLNGFQYLMFCLPPNKVENVKSDYCAYVKKLTYANIFIYDGTEVKDSSRIWDSENSYTCLLICLCASTKSVTPNTIIHMRRLWI